MTDLSGLEFSAVEATYRHAWSLEWDRRMTPRARNVWKNDADKIIESIQGQPLRKLFRPAEKAIWIKLYANLPDSVANITDEILEIEKRGEVRLLARVKREYESGHEAVVDFLRTVLSDTIQISAFDPTQPRDENGKWTDGTSSDAPETHSASRLASRDKKDVDIEKVIHSIPGAANRIAKARELLAKGVPTDAPVGDGGFKLPNGEWTPERVRVHEKILGAIFTKDAVGKARPPQGQAPTATVLGGRGGSGKSWLTGPSGPVKANNAIVINSDDFKVALPEYAGWNAGLLHEETKYLTAVAENMARELKINVVHDETMRRGTELVKRVEEYKKQGYKVEGYYMYAPPQTAAERAIGRFVRGGSGNKMGRFVPPEYVASSTTNEETFDKMRPHFDNWAIYDNSGVGKGPQLYAKKVQAAALEGTATQVTPEHIKEVLVEGRKLADMLNYDSKLVSIGASESPDAKFTLNGIERRAAGLAYITGPAVGHIKLFPNQIQDADIARQVVAHEVMHQKFQYALNAYRYDSNEIAKEPGPPPDPNGKYYWQKNGGKDAVMKPDGGLRPPYDKKYPTYTEMHEALFKYGMNEGFSQSDGVSDYSFEYWKGWKSGTISTELALHETLAEIARVKYQTGEYPDHMGERIISYREGDKPSAAQIAENKARWKTLYETVSRIYFKNHRK